MLHRSAHPGYGVDDRNPSVLVPMPGQHMPTAGNARIKRTLAVKDGDGKIMRGPKGGIRRKPVASDGEVLTDRIRIRRINRKGDHAMLDTGRPNPGALGHNVFEEDVREISAPRHEADRKRLSMAETIALAYEAGHVSLADLRATNPKLYNRVLSVLSER